MRQFVALAALAAMACGGGASADTASAEGRASDAVASSVSGGSTTVNGAVHTVDMVLNDAGEYRFVPDELTIASGDEVEWINVSGGPHNVQFFADKMPAGAEGVLNDAMADKIGNLSGALMIAPDAVYKVSFAGAPAGVYEYTCTPHQLLGMNAQLTVQ